MNVLTSENSTKVMHEFKFSVDQVKHSKCKQFFIYADLADWMEEVFKTKLNSWSDWNAIKIIYNKIHHHTDLNHVKCIELYYDGNSRNDTHLNKLDELNDITKFMMSWISETTYYVTNKSQFVKSVITSLEENNLLAFLDNNYNMPVKFCGEHNIQVFTFSPALNNSQIIKLSKIFRGISCATERVRFMSREFLFLNSHGPPLTMNGELLTALNCGFMDALSIEDILSLELANKDHRLSWCDHALDRDIQKHLRRRLPQLYKNGKCDVYHANSFTDLRICCYFIHKYSHRCSIIMIRKRFITESYFRLLTQLYPNLAEYNTNDYAVWVTMVSPKNGPICIVTYIVSTDDLTNITDININLISKRVDIDMNKYFSPTDFYRIRQERVGASLENMRIDVLKKMTPDDLIRVLQEHSKSPYNLNRLIVCCNDFGYDHVKNSILKKMLPSWLIDHDFNQHLFTFEFKKITFHVKSLYKYFRRLSAETSSVKQIDISFIECEFILNTAVVNTLVRKYNTISVNLNDIKFVKMDLEIQTVLLILSGAPVDGEILFDDCRIHNSATTIPISRINIFSMRFRKMSLSSETLVTIFKVAINLEELTFDNCQIHLDNNDLSHDRLSKVVCHIVNAELELETLWTIMDIFTLIKIENCDIPLGDASDHIASNISIGLDYIGFDKMNINAQKLLTILTKRKQIKHIEFTSCQFFVDLTISRKPAELNRIVFHQMSFSPALLNLLRYFNSDCYTNLKWCNISHHDLLDICRRTCNYGKYITVLPTDRINEIIYFELIAEFYKNNLDTINFQLEQNLEIPFHIFPNIKYSKEILWDLVQIKSIPVNDGTIKVEFLFKGKPVDLFFSVNSLPDDSDVCEVNYY